MTDNRSRERRIHPRRFYHPERRTGFDRRREHSVLSTLRDNPSALLGVLFAFNALSVADWLLTSHGLAHGAIEANAVIASLITVSPLVAIAFKSGCTLAVSALIWHTRRYRMVLATAIVGVAIYCGLMVYHVVGLASMGAL